MEVDGGRSLGGRCKLGRKRRRGSSFEEDELMHGVNPHKRKKALEGMFVLEEVPIKTPNPRFNGELGCLYRE